ncbi:hypothetical protein SpCBS45565_g00336 [Spizellomyces sp. 'palustris']|nr:hypothetical protein SpCBS45565_g00336 [Spizellomyces sp. 'palustris']
MGLLITIVISSVTVMFFSWNKIFGHDGLFLECRKIEKNWKLSRCPSPRQSNIAT